MAFIRRYQVTINPNSSAVATYSTNINPEQGGWLESIVVRNATANGIITSAKLTITQGGRTLWDATATGATNTTLAWYPRVQVHQGTTALALVENATAPPPNVDKFPIAAGVPININVASAGAVSGAARSVEVDLYIGG